MGLYVPHEFKKRKCWLTAKHSRGMIPSMRNKQIIKLAASINGKKGGKARKEALSKERRIEIGLMGAKARWKKR